MLAEENDLVDEQNPVVSVAVVENPTLINLPIELLQKILLDAGGVPAANLESLHSKFRNFAADNVFWMKMVKSWFQLQGRLVFETNEENAFVPKFICQVQRGEESSGNLWKENFKMLFNSVNLVDRELKRWMYNGKTVVGTDRANRTILMDKLVLIRPGRVAVNYKFLKRHYPDNLRKTPETRTWAHGICWVGEGDAHIAFERKEPATVRDFCKTLPNALFAFLNVHNFHLSLDNYPDSPLLTFYKCKFHEKILLYVEGRIISFIDCAMPRSIWFFGYGYNVRFYFRNCHFFEDHQEMEINANVSEDSYNFHNCLFTSPRARIMVSTRKNRLMEGCRFENCEVTFVYGTDLMRCLLQPQILRLTNNTFVNCVIKAEPRGVKQVQHPQLLDDWLEELKRNNTLIDTSVVRHL